MSTNHGIMSNDRGTCSKAILIPQSKLLVQCQKHHNTMVHTVSKNHGISWCMSKATVLHDKTIVMPCCMSKNGCIIKKKTCYYCGKCQIITVPCQKNMILVKKQCQYHGVCPKTVVQ